MKNQKFGFTLIELLVVIVIIGILATISTATFSGYFKKARDTERQSFVRNAQQILIASQVAEDTADYEDINGDGTTPTTATLAAEIPAELTTQGYTVPKAKNGQTYHYLADGAEFVMAVCAEDGDGTDIFEAGTTAGVAWTSCTANALVETQPVGGFECVTGAADNVFVCAASDA